MLSRFQKEDKESVQVEKNQYVVFNVEEEEFGVDIKQTREIINITELTPIPNAPDFVKGVINLRGEIVPVVKLDKRLSLNLDDTKENKDEKIIIVEVNNTLIGMKVNAVNGIIRLSHNDIGETPKITQGKINKDYLVGVGKLEDRLLILLNLEKILSDEEVQQLDEIEI